MDVFFEWLSQNNIIAILTTLAITILNTILLYFKTRKSKAEKAYIQACKEVSDSLVPADYLCKIGDLYYSMTECQFILKSEVSLDDYIRSEEVKKNEKENAKVC